MYKKKSTIIVNNKKDLKEIQRVYKIYFIRVNGFCRKRYKSHHCSQNKTVFYYQEELKNSEFENKFVICLAQIISVLY